MVSDLLNETKDSLTTTSHYVLWLSFYVLYTKGSANKGFFSSKMVPLFLKII